MRLAGLAAVVWVALGAMQSAAQTPRIDRRALVSRHDPVLRQFDPESPLSVGNGEFAFTADVTGLQTFPEAFERTIPLTTQSQWGWHNAPNPEGWSIERYRFSEFESFGRKVPYADIPGDLRTPEVAWLRSNPHRLHLGQIGLRLQKADGAIAKPQDLGDIVQRLDLWNGLLTSRFCIDGQPVEVLTVCHPERDTLAVRVASPLLRNGRIAILLQFPYGTGAPTAADWTKPNAHVTQWTPSHSGARFLRRLDGDTYHVAGIWSIGATLTEETRHSYRLVPPKDAGTLDLICAFSGLPQMKDPPRFDETYEAVSRHWNGFWNRGGAVDLSGSRDPRWRELERRIILSQYLTAIQCSGSLPPQETGLTYNSWEGKFHLEMHWWHAAHFALWNRVELLERSLGYYKTILPQARATAKRQGYSGARWPKMTGPTGVESPSAVGPFLVWQQPHPIYYAELCFRARPDRTTLTRYQQVVFETADFMASFAEWDAPKQRYVLGPVLQCAQEVFPKDRTLNPTFELTYWRWGLETAQRWRQRLGLAREPVWDRVLKQLAPLPVADGKYLFAESTPDCYADPKWSRDHPSVTAALGMLPGPGIDTATMERTLGWIWEHWNWPTTWGWDYPMLAMCAARLGQPDRAVSALLLDTPKNRYRINGHNHQRPGLTIYLPGNGGLLAAVAMMAAGWDSGPTQQSPGFPADGSWTVRWEGLKPMP